MDTNGQADNTNADVSSVHWGLCLCAHFSVIRLSHLALYRTNSDPVSSVSTTNM